MNWSDMQFSGFAINDELPILKEVPRQLNVSRLDRYVNQLKDTLLIYGTKVLISIALLIIGLFLIRLIVRALSRLMIARDVDVTLQPFLRSMISTVLKVMLFLSIASMLGIETTSFVAALGATGLAIGLALQGSLSNFAGGMLILFFKPFKVGDMIAGTAGTDFQGKVKEIQVLYTILITSDNKHVVVPNGNLSNNKVVNFSANDVRRTEIKLFLQPDTDLQKAKILINNIVDNEPGLKKDLQPVIGFNEMTEHAVVLVVWAWFRTEDLGNATMSIYEKALTAFAAEGIKTPMERQN